MHDRTRPERAGGGTLDLLRFGAAALVVLYHYGVDAPSPLEELAPVFGRGWLATDFFLLLSGYVLGRAYGRKLDGGALRPGEFVVRRLRRIWPAHLLVLAGFAVLLTLAAWAGVGPAHPERFGVEAFWLQAVLAHAWGFTDQPSWNVPSWTLSALVVCYLLFPLAWRAVRPLQGRWAALLAAGTIVFAGAAFSSAVIGRPLYDLPFQYGVVRALPLFVAGALLARFLDVRTFPLRTALWAGLAGAAAFVFLAVSPRSALADFGAIAALALVVVAADLGRPTGPAWAAKGAALSMALYITHALAGALWFGAARALAARLALPAVGSWLLWAGSLPFAFGFAWAFHRYVDAPLQARLAGFTPRRAPRPAPAPSG